MHRAIGYNKDTIKQYLVKHLARRVQATVQHEQVERSASKAYGDTIEDVLDNYSIVDYKVTRGSIQFDPFAYEDDVVEDVISDLTDAGWDAQQDGDVVIIKRTKPKSFASSKSVAVKLNEVQNVQLEDAQELWKKVNSAKAAFDNVRSQLDEIENLMEDRRFARAPQNSEQAQLAAGIADVQKKARELSSGETTGGLWGVLNLLSQIVKRPVQGDGV